MLLAKNGRASSSKWTHHMNICYFFVTDQIQVGDIRVEYCPTDDMIADFFTKLLQGGKFIRFHDQILNTQTQPDITAISAQRSVLGNKAQVDPTQRGRQAVQRNTQRTVGCGNTEEEAVLHHQIG